MAASHPHTRVKGYLFEVQHLGCTKLYPGGHIDSYGRHTPVLGKLVPQETLQEYLKTEGHVHSLLKNHPHPSLSTPIDCIESEDGNGYVVFPAVHHDLHSHIRENIRLPERQARHIFRQLASAVRHCHHHGIILRDMKLGKVYFIDRARTQVTLADLDGAQMVNPDMPLLNDQRGSPAYVSPEVLTFQPYCGAAADMWSLGVMLFVILTGSYPFQDNRPATLFQKIQKASAAVKFPSFVSRSARSLVRKLLSRDPAGRPTAEQLCRDAWLCEEDVMAMEVPEPHVTDSIEDTVPDLASPSPVPKRTRRRRLRPPPLHIPVQSEGAPPLLSPGIETAPLPGCPQPRKRTFSEQQRGEEQQVITPTTKHSRRRRATGLRSPAHIPGPPVTPPADALSSAMAF